MRIDGKFQSTLPTRGSDAPRHSHGTETCKFQSTLPTRGSDQCHKAGYNGLICISIHAPHEGERRNGGTLTSSRGHFNPRSPRGGATGKKPK